MAVVAHVDRDVARGEPFVSLCLLSIEAIGDDNEMVRGRAKGGGVGDRPVWVRSRWGTNPSRDDHDIEAVVCQEVLADEFAHATHGCQCDGLTRCCHDGGSGGGGDDEGCQ